MAVVVKIEDVRRLIAKIQGRIARARRDQGSVVVGYTQDYAVYVHENMGAYHAPPTQAKYLEQPARQLSNMGVLSSIVSTALRAGQTLMMGLLQAGLRIQRESQKIVPVDTAALKNSAFTRTDKRR